MRARLIANPSSGTDRAPALLPQVAGRLRPLVPDLDITITTGADDIARAAVRALDERCDLLLVAGGDGTLNIAVRAVAAVPGGLERIVFGVVPAGTGNDFAKALDLGEDPDDALDALGQARVIDVDLGILNDRTFINVSAGGFVADVSAALTEELKDAAGKLAYVIGGARVLFGRDPFRADVRGGGPHLGATELQMFAVCNARFIGGGHPIAPAALIDDGLLDVLLVPSSSTLEFLAVLQRLASGQAESDDSVIHFRTAALELAFDRTINLNTDGEVLASDRCRYSVRHRAARFLCGPRPHASAAPRRLTA